MPTTRTGKSAKSSKSTKSSRSAKTTTDHKTIQRWAEARNGHPAQVKRTGSGDEPGILRIDFPGFSGEDSLEPISWDEFFKKFDKEGLAFLYEDEKDNRFNKLINRDRADDR